MNASATTKVMEKVASLRQKQGRAITYTPQMALKELLLKYPHLKGDPVHEWRSLHDVELIHQEPDKEELKRIIRNWKLMNDEQKRLSDEKSMELFGTDNLTHAKELIGKYAQTAVGIPDRSVYGDLAKLSVGEQLNYVRQLHDAERAGRHEDLRFGNEPLGLYSWAVPKARMPGPGERLLALRQPQHTNNYAEFEGKIRSGYGKGLVKTVDKGSVEITKVSPKVVSFVVTHGKHPETYSLVNTGGNKWLIVNTTPQKSKALESHKKVKYTSVDPAKVKDFLNGDYAVSGKIDGASGLFELFKDRIEAVSYRTQAGTKGKPIIHTYRMGLGSTKPPPESVGSVLKGEIYGERGGKAIPAQELGGLLNMSTAKSKAAQQERKVKLRAAIYDIASYRNAQPSAHYGERLDLMRTLVPNIAPQTLEMAPTETEPSAATKLFERIQAGRHPLTAEGIVATPLVGGGAPTKLKFKEDADVYVKDIFPAVTKGGKPRAGGFAYSLEPEGPAVGRVGTGFDHATLQDMLANPKDYIGRRARIEAQQKFPSGAYRAPSFTALHEDYPAITKGGSAPNDCQKKAGWLSDKMIGKAGMDKLAQLTHMYKGVRMFGPRGIKPFREAAHKGLQRFANRYYSALFALSDRLPRSWQLTKPKEQLVGAMSWPLKRNLAASIVNPRVAGTSVAGSNVALIKEPGTGAGRTFIAHEGFHARHPILGISENLAHFAGGWGAPRGAGPLRRLLSGVSEVRRYHSPTVQAHYRAKRQLV